MSGWYPGATSKDQGTNGGTYLGGPPRVTIHTTEGTSPTGGRDWYHFTVGIDPDNGRVLTYQWRTVDKAAKGLRNLSGGVQTNRRGRPHIQIAIATRAANIQAVPPDVLLAVRKIIEWAHQEHGVPLVPYMAIGHGTGSYGYQGLARMSVSEWLWFSGVAGHQNVPENTHWDPGTLNYNALLGLNPGAELPTSEEDEMKRGDEGLRVEVMQERLNDLSFGPLRVDGDFGPATEGALMTWQLQVGLEPDGILRSVDAGVLFRLLVNVANDPIARTKAGAAQARADYAHVRLDKLKEI